MRVCWVAEGVLIFRVQTSFYLGTRLRHDCSRVACGQSPTTSSRRVNPLGLGLGLKLVLRVLSR